MLMLTMRLLTYPTRSDRRKPATMVPWVGITIGRDSDRSAEFYLAKSATVAAFRLTLILPSSHNSCAACLCAFVRSSPNPFYQPGGVRMKWFLSYPGVGFGKSAKRTPCTANLEDDFQ